MSSRKLVSEDTPRQGYTTTIEYESSPKGLHATRVTVESETNPITATVIREVKTMELMRKDMKDNPDAKMDLTTARYLIKGEFKFPKGINGHAVRLQAVREIYEHAAVTGEPPAKAVSEAMNVSIATAGRWIRKSKNELHWG